MPFAFARPFWCMCALSVIVCVVLCGSCFVFCVPLLYVHICGCVRCSMCVWSVVYVVVWFITVVWFVGVCVCLNVRVVLVMCCVMLYGVSLRVLCVWVCHSMCLCVRL